MQESALTREAAGLEARYGDLGEGWALFDAAIDAFHRAGNQPSLAMTLGKSGHGVSTVSSNRDRGEKSTEPAPGRGSIDAVPGLPAVVEHLRVVLGAAVFADRVARGAALEVGDAVAYARHEIRLARQPGNST